MLRTVLLLLSLIASQRFAGLATGADQNERVDRPNIVWLVMEDNSPHWLRLYNPAGGAPMPNVERLAAKGLVFKHAFSNAPVCSVARSTIISGCYAPRVGAQYHRRTTLVPLPGDLKMFPHYLRHAGYHTTNNSKEDYNFIKSPQTWDASSGKATYRDRKPGQPFFHVQNFGTTHEGQLHFGGDAPVKRPTSFDPADVTLFPYHPDTPLFRYTYTAQLEHHRKVDEQIGQFLEQLKADDLLDETIIFCYGDHGGVLPRSKGYAYESGLQVPMIVSFPQKWRHLFPADPGNRIDGFVSFVDLAPTVLNLVGIDVPKEMDGKPFLGKGIRLDELNQRDTAFGYADRFDEKYDFVRTLRKGNFKYMRSYQPFNIDGLHNDYRYKMLAYDQWRSLYHQGKLNDVQRQFFEPRPAEQLFDLDADPHEVYNLAGDPSHLKKLRELRNALHEQVLSLPDLSFYPESYFVREGAGDPTEFGQEHQQEVASLIAIADLSLLPFEEAEPKLSGALSSKNRWERYWGCIACSSFGNQASSLIPNAKQIAGNDDETLVRVRAAEFLGLISAEDPRPFILEALEHAAQSEDRTEANLILNTAALLEESKPGYDFTIPDDLFKSNKKKDLVRQRIEYLNQ